MNLNVLKERVQRPLREKKVAAWFGDNTPADHHGRYISFELLEQADYQTLENYIKLFLDEFTKYPKQFIGAIKLKSVNFVKNLKVDSTASNNFIPLSATVDPHNASLILDINPKSQNDDYKRQCIHHELFHLIEFNMHGDFVYHDKVWGEFNQKDFVYGKGGASAYFTQAFQNKIHPSAGFVSEYAMLGIDEDRAETFMYMMTDHLKPLLRA